MTQYLAIMDNSCLLKITVNAFHMALNTPAFPVILGDRCHD